MATNIIYTNETGSVLTEQQVSLLTSYTIITYEDGNIKKTERTGMGKGNIYRSVQCYLDPTEDKDEIIQSYSDGKTGLTIYFNAQSQNGFTQWNSEGYAPVGTLKSKGISVYNSENWVILSCSLDLNSGDPIAGGIKNYYGNHSPNQFDDRLLQFDYNADGSLDSITDFNDTYGFNDGSVQLDYFLSYMQSIQQDFSWNQHPYFHSLTPYLPDSTDL